VAPRLAWLTLALLAASGCSLVLDFDQPIVDAGAVRADASPNAIDAGVDIYEPNDTPQQATAIDRGLYQLSIAPVGDRDYFSFTVQDPSDVVITLSSTGSADLDLELYALPDLTTPIAMSRNASTSEEELRFTTSSGGQLAGGSYVIGVIEFNDQASAEYTLSLSILL
jgi:hypothetical protein